ncbi:NRPS [Paraconiothyrium brasiliense]|uniref:NRPS n=1 Tax=Paraconiothyrium brasiliense TaxID=300254 RepID=A0ABR3RRH0_9PLEO
MQLGIALKMTDILRSKTISNMAQAAKSIGNTQQQHVEISEKLFELSPIQQMFEEMGGIPDIRFNQSFYLRVNRPITHENLEKAIATIVERHPMLRAQYIKTVEGKWQQSVQRNAQGRYYTASHDLRRSSLAVSVMERAQHRIRPETGPLFSVDLLNVSGDGQFLYLVAHHLVIDLVSWRIIFQDLELLLLGRSLPISDSLPFQSWLALQTTHASSLDVNTVLPFRIQSSDFAYWDMEGKANIYADVERHEFSLTKDVSMRLLEQCHIALGTEPVELLLAALFHSFAIVFPDRATPTIFSEGHGREPYNPSLDVSNTVGWFTTMSPLHVSVSGDSVIDIVRRTKDVRRSITRNGFDYFASRYLTAQGREAFGKSGPMEVLFNYLGQFQGLERDDSLLHQQALPEGAIQSDFDEKLNRFALFEISATVLQGIVSFQFLYNRRMARKADVLRWAGTCAQSLNDITDLLPTMASEKTLIDFPLVPLTYEALQGFQETILPDLGLSSLDDVEDLYPLTPMQNGLILSQTRNPDTYKTSFTFKVTSNRSGRIDERRLLEAWQRVVNSHAMLRTVFTDRIFTNGVFYQLVLAKSKANTLLLNCDIDEEAVSLLANYPALEYNDSAPPHRLIACQIKSGSVFFKFDASHALVDADSVGILLRDLSQAYQAQQPLSVGPPYSEYIKYLDSRPMEISVKYWSDYLHRVVPCYLPMINDVQGTVSCLRSIHLSLGNLSSLMRKFCATCSVTMPSVFHLAWSIVLCLYTGAEDVTYGYLVSGRDVAVPGITKTIGPFINMMVSRTCLSPSATISALVQKKQSEYAAGIEHQACSLAQIQHALSLSDQPLFNTMISIQALGNKKTSDELTLSFEGVGSHDPTEYDISLGIYSDNENAEAHFGYWADRLSDWHADNVAQTFKKVLKQLLSNPWGNIDSVRQLSERDVRQVQLWTPLQRPGSSALVHMLFADQAARSPKSIAIESFEGKITYSELEDISTRFSRHLIDLGVRPGTVVPFCFPKSAWAIVSMLAILKAGGTGLPLSPDHPLDRVRILVEDCSATLIVCAPDQARRLSALRLTLIPFSQSHASALPKTSVSITVDPESSAFLIYTSGSTGLPKGVMISHRAITTNVPEIAQTWGWASNSRILQFIAYTFDPMLGDIFGALFTGACLCVISDNDRMKDITPVINSMKISHIVLTPSLARTLQPEKLTSLKSLVCGGEAITERDIEMWKGHVELINAYGPTEATIAVTSLHYSRRGTSDPRNIGRPLRFSSLWVADPDDIKMPVPIGAVGELLIGGQTLANGYLNDEEKTKKAFVKAPKWTGLGDSIVYRTGDLVRWAFDGTIHFVGRKDTQIKIRGQRVEAGEVESTIKAKLPGLKDVAVVLTAPRNRSMDPVLTAFLSWSTELEPQTDSLLASLTEPLASKLMALDTKLADALPSYMIPAMYIPIQYIPLTVSGKTDVFRLQSLVSSLSEPDLAHFSLSDGPKQQPSSRIEKKLQQIWSEVLDLEREQIGLNDSFFRSGGDSLSAIQLTSRASRDDIHLTIALIFQNPKLSDMAAAAEDLSSQTIYDQLQEQFGISKETVQDLYPSTPLQESLMLLSMKTPGSYRLRRAWTLPASVNVDIFKKAVSLVVLKEPILRTRIVNLESIGSMQVVMKEHINITEVLSEAEFWGLERRLTMSYGQPLLKCCILQHSDEAPKFLLAMHHVLYDEWSINLLLNSIESVYQEVIQEKAISSKVASSSLSDFVDYVAQSNENEAKAYWKAQLSGAAPVNFPRLPSASYQRKNQSLSTHLKLPTKQSTPYELPVLLKAAWSIIVARYSGADDVTFGLTVQGRNVPVEGIDAIMGPTLATVPLRMHIDWNASIEQFISSVSDQASDMKAFEHVGLQRIAQSTPEADSACDFQHLLVIHERKPTAASEDFWIKTSLGQIEELSSYPLTLQLYLNGSSVEVAVSYDEMVLDAHQLKLILANFEQTLGQLVTASLDRPLKFLNLLGNNDQRAIMKLNRTIPAGLETRIDQLFEIQRVARPKAEAVHSWDTQFTYQQLYEHAIRLAHHLQALGVGPEVLVPLCFDKSAWTIVAQLGVLYAGGAFVVMDATHPVQRLQQIIRDTKAHLVLASASREGLCRTIAPQVVLISPETITAFPSKASPPLNKATSRNTAYVLFTSGSTGKPKGVVMEHRAVCTAAMEQGKRINMDSSSRVLQYASYAFDSTILETFHTLLHGGCICPLSQEQRLNDIVDGINQLQANWAFFTPSLARTLEPEQVPCLKTVVLGGEVLGIDNIEIWANRTYLANGYGPTETCVFSSILDHVTDSDRPDNIGRAVGGANWVVDAHDTNVLVPVGAVGELLIEGPTVARGYLNDSGKTEEAFIKRPMWLDESLLGRPVERVYKTGDLATLRPDGTVLYIGRKDTQVKIRGQRVELGEIEHHLKRRLPQLAHVAVDQVSLPHRNNTKVLAAFFCRDRKEKEGKPETRRIDSELYSDLMALTSTLTDILPVYMIPTMFILLASMPLSSSGKTDRRRLHAVAENLTDEETTHFFLADVERRSPISKVEKKMQSMWANVLNIPVESIGCDDSFVRLGGDSLSAMKLVALARKAGISIRVDHIFRNPTLSAMSSITTTFKEEVTKARKPFSLLRGQEPLEAILEKLEKAYNIPRISVQDIYPTSSLQEGLMVLSARQPGTYNFQWDTVLPSSVDPERFQRAWQTCVKRNTILRTRIVYTELSGSLQVVLNDESQWTTTGSLEDYLRADKLDIMDYGKSLTRWAIIGDHNGKTHFVWSAHHSIYDGWALPLVLQEVARIYHASDISLLPSPPPYARFIEYLESRDRGAEFAYWHSQYPPGEALSNFPPIQSSAIQPLANVTVTKDIEFTLGNASTSGFTTSTLIRAAWAIVLSRYGEVNDALFGALLAGRNVPIKDIASMTGPTITTVPVHIQVSPDQTVHAFLDDVQRQAVEMMPYEHTGLQHIKLFTRETQEACNFQNLLVIQPKQESDEAHDLWRTGNTIDFAFDEFLTYPLVFQVVLGNTLGLTLKLDDRLLSAERGQRMLEHFSHVIQQLSEADKRTLADIDITSPLDFAELQQWNDPTSSVFKPSTMKTVHNLITDQARLSPNSAAVCSWDDNFTYSEIDTLSSRVATHLRKLGVHLETYVLLCFDKSAWAIIAMLGTLKAGAAYVAVDPTHPADRKAFIARDVSATVAVTSPQHQHMFNFLVEHVVGIDKASVHGFALNTTLPSVPPSNPAFVVFTSGSTGTPKGIVMEHGSFSAGAFYHAPALNISCNARVLQFAAYTYDVSMGEIFSTLMHGGCVCVPTEEERLSNLAGAINSMSANWLFLTPTVASLLNPASVPTLQYLVLGGEHATTVNIQSWAEHVHLTNSYGPAECAIWTNHAPGLKRDADPSNIGRRIGSLLWIVEADNHDKLTPAGCVGELVVESHSLARGYLNDPAKTAAAFITAPKWAGAGRRMYKTGDLAKYNFDGTMSIVGRKDNQVKLNGQRMELGEVEHHLWADEEVDKVMAIVPATGPCKKQLVSVLSLRHINKTLEGTDFVLVNKNQKVEVGSQISRLREKIGSKLPRYMVPTIWIVLEDLPLNTSGKLDRRRVSEWIQEMDDEKHRSAIELAQSDKIMREPSNKFESSIRRLWSKVLGVGEETLSMDDNFLQLGGDSISAVRLTAAARQEGITLLVREIFQKPVLSAMSAAAKWEEVVDQVAYEPFSVFTREQQKAALEQVAEKASQPVENIEDVLEATDYQSWTLAAGHLRTRGYMNYFGIRFDTKLDIKELKKACLSVIARHPILRTVLVVQDQRLLQVVLKQYEPEYTCYEHHDESRDEAVPRALIEKDMERPVILGHGIMRFILVKLRDNRHRLVLRISHAQYDGISLPSILQDIKAAYEGIALSNSKPYSSFIYNVRNEGTRRSETFWSALLKDSHMTNVLRHKRVPYKNPVNRMFSRTVTPSFLNTQGVTFATTVKAAWALVLSSLALTPDTVFGQVVSGRNGSLAGIQDVVGPCMNIIPVRVQLQLTWTNSDLLHFVQDQHLASMPHENFGMRQIIERCTNWPKATRFSSILQHTNFGKQFFGEVLSASAGSEMTGYSPPHDVADVWIWTAPVSEGMFSVDLTFADGVVEDEIAQLMLDMLCKNIEDISVNQDTRILLPSGSAAQIPIAYDEEKAKAKYFAKVEPQAALSITGVEEIVARAWEEVFGAGASEDQDLEWWDIRGDLMAAVLLAEFYSKATGADVSVESVIENGSKNQQIRLLGGE